ncbi:hypothetical protein AB1Y20_016289 [Prymnesium parvum]|uniref:Hexosyltransferase n=1 Tax=Prymnesium parvum TaxID=97485 RepID=A0AB34IEC5_PRYPA
MLLAPLPSPAAPPPPACVASRLPLLHRLNAQLDLLPRNRTVLSLVWDIHRDRSHGVHRASHNQTEAEARRLHRSVLTVDPLASLVWLVSASDHAELLGWRLDRVLLVPLSPPELDAWAACVGVPRLAHHAGPRLGAIELLAPLLRLPTPAMLVDLDTVALARWPLLWPAPTTPAAAWTLAHGVEHRHINSGMLAWATAPEEAVWLACVARAALFLTTPPNVSVRAYDPTHLRFGEQAAFVQLCAASRSAEWRQASGCHLDCFGYSSALYTTGCSPAYHQTPVAAYHYNCYPRGTLERAEQLLRHAIDPSYVLPKPAKHLG